MGIVFFCQSCGAGSRSPRGMAGKKGHCKKCGQVMTIPRAEEIASMAAMPALAMAGVDAVPAAAAGGSSISSWLKAGISQAVMAPLTLDRKPAIRPILASALDDAEDSKPYILAQQVRENRGRVKVQDNVVLQLWRRQLGGIQKLFRKINQAAYLVSVPFLMMMLLGIGFQSRQLAIMGATAVVLLNIGRIVAGAANLAIVPFRDGVNVKKLKKPAWRVAEPVLTIGVVVLAFTFIPWLSRGQSAKGSIIDRVRSTAQDLKKDMRGQVDRVVDVDKLGARPRRRSRRSGTRPRSSTSTSWAPRPRRSSRDSVPHRAASRPRRARPGEGSP